MSGHGAGVALTEFQIILTMFGIAGSAFGVWLWRHERWFRNIVFPVVQALTGQDPRGQQVDATNRGHFRETENRLQRIEEDVEDLSESVSNLQERQNRHNQTVETYLRRIIARVEGISLDDIEKPLFRNEGDSGTADD